MPISGPTNQMQTEEHQQEMMMSFLWIHNLDSKKFDNGFEYERKLSFVSTCGPVIG